MTAPDTHLSPYAYMDFWDGGLVDVDSHDAPLTYCGLYRQLNRSNPDFKDVPTVAARNVRFTDEEDPELRIEDPVKVVTCEACTLLQFSSKAEETHNG